MEERKAFQSIADGLETSIKQNQAAFETTIQRIGGLTHLSVEELNEATGGDSYCYVDLGGVPEGIIANIVQKGKYPLFDVRVVITDVDAFGAALKTNSIGDIDVYRKTFPVIPFLTRASLWPPDRLSGWADNRVQKV